MFELAVRVYVNGVAVISQRRKCILAEIETGDARGFFRPPMPAALISILAFVDFRAGRRKTKLARPMKGQVVAGEGSGIAQMWIPAFARSHKQNAVTGVANDVAVVANCKFDLIVS